MRRKVLVKTVAAGLLVSMALLTVQVSAQPPARMGGAFGDWLIKVDFGQGRQMDAILSFSRSAQGRLTGQWISFMGITDLRDVAMQDGKLTFSYAMRGRDNQEMISTFTGAVEEGKLTGALTGGGREMKVEGTRPPRMPRILGQWEMKYAMGERQVTSTLIITADKEGALSGLWKTPRGEAAVSDLKFERNALTFKRVSRFQDREFESTFEGALQGDVLKGTIKSQRGEIAVEGARIGADLIGTWNLEIAGEQGATAQRLSVNPDLSGLYGTLPVKQITLEDGKISFAVVMEFGDRKFETNFEGALVDGKLSGEVKTSRGSRKVTGTKIVRTFRRPENQ